ncbi:histidine decarboxylase [Catellatospora sp. TT07R-123]|uniref:pyridoxal-dependent decarboxylase n=1 Tax=Catellatospora sp. TT07R-123 TaxID=2733863 RepID=UPI001B1BE722|nr:pyridoxal-dependent decarboxylase [Catellatospora sp. TT07R-123]GHJ48792.1 histidine decarboxylase [Catellatospora sp. TT07R-123]
MTGAPVTPLRPAAPPLSVAATLRDLTARLAQSRHYDIGFPGAVDLVFPELSELMTGHLLNNVGDAWGDPGHGVNHTKELEREVVTTIGDLFQAPRDCWGYVTGGASEGTEHALDEAWQRYPDIVVYTSAAAHYSVAKAARKLKLQLVIVRTDVTGRMDVADLAGELARRRERPAMIVATAGTTMTEAIDDVAAIREVCDDLAIIRRRIHVDAAMAGVPLALLPERQRPAFDFAAGATSMVVSGHKFLSTLMPCGVLVYAQSPYRNADTRVSYTGSADTTITGSRSGHTPLILWTVLNRVGLDGLRARAEASRRLADYTHKQLCELGWDAHRNPHAFTVTLPSPPSGRLGRWVLADDGRLSHVVCMPGITVNQIDEFLSTLGHGPGRRRMLRSRAAASSAVLSPAV